jgi:hypothetical protein
VVFFEAGRTLTPNSVAELTEERLRDSDGYLLGKQDENGNWYLVRHDDDGNWHLGNYDGAGNWHRLPDLDEGGGWRRLLGIPSKAGRDWQQLLDSEGNPTQNEANVVDPRTIIPKWGIGHNRWGQEQWVCTDGVHKLVPIRGGFIDHYLLIAIALGTIFVGAVTYIANAPNFLIKSIAAQDGIPMPSFFGFMVYSFLIVVPLMVAVMWIWIP